MNKQKRPPNTMRLYLNCSPYQERGAWRLHGGEHFHHLDLPQKHFDAVNAALEALLEKGAVCSYFIAQQSDPLPVIDYPSA